MVDVPYLFVKIIVQTGIWESKRPITLNQLQPKIHMTPSSLLDFCIKIVSRISPFAKYMYCSTYMVLVWRLNLKPSKSSKTITWLPPTKKNVTCTKDPWPLMVAIKNHERWWNSMKEKINVLFLWDKIKTHYVNNQIHNVNNHIYITICSIVI